MTSSTNTDEGNKYSPPMISHSLLADDSKRWREKVPVGIRFKPTDQILVGHYLTGKVSDCTDGPIFNLIKEVDVYQYEPSQLSSLSYDFGDGKMYFFTLLIKRKNAHRQFSDGFWEKSGKPSYVQDKDGKPMATKTTVVYYKKDKKCNLVKTQWLMKEYMLLDNQLSNQNDEEFTKSAPWTLCVAYYGLKRCRENQKGSDDEKNNNLSSYLCNNPISGPNSPASINKRNSDRSVKRINVCKQ